MNNKEDRNIEFGIGLFVVIHVAVIIVMAVIKYS